MEPYKRVFPDLKRFREPQIITLQEPFESVGLERTSCSEHVYCSSSLPLKFFFLRLSKGICRNVCVFSLMSNSSLICSRVSLCAFRRTDKAEFSGCSAHENSNGQATFENPMYNTNTKSIEGKVVRFDPSLNTVCTMV